METEYSNIAFESALPFLKGLQSLYIEMDQQYDAAAAQYPFECNGCEDNCCQTFFHHHTIVEYLYLKFGFIELPHGIQQKIFERVLYESMTRHEGLPSKFMCPLNTDGLCLLYRFRPMICRLHGIPNEIRRPDGITLRGPGCPQFEKHFSENAYINFDRTPFYLRMATIEKNLKNSLKIATKFKKTVSEMITEFSHETP